MPDIPGFYALAIATVVTAVVFIVLAMQDVRHAVVRRVTTVFSFLFILFGSVSLVAEVDHG